MTSVVLCDRCSKSAASKSGLFLSKKIFISRIRITESRGFREDTTYTAYTADLCDDCSETIIQEINSYGKRMDSSKGAISSERDRMEGRAD